MKLAHFYDFFIHIFLLTLFRFLTHEYVLLGSRFTLQIALVKVEALSENEMAQKNEEKKTTNF
jgi:hypothetical protein